MASFRCYDNSDVIATLITTNFHLYLIQLWWQFFQMFVYGDVVYAQTWQVLTNRWNRSHLSWIFSNFFTFTLHTFVLTQMCPLFFPNVEPSVFWSIEMTANPNQHWGVENHTSVSRFVTRIVAINSMFQSIVTKYSFKWLQWFFFAFNTSTREFSTLWYTSSLKKVSLSGRSSLPIF